MPKFSPRFDSRVALSCHEYLHKKHAENLFDLSDRILEDPLVDALKKAGGEHEEKVIKYLKSLGIPYTQIDKTQSDKGIELQTLKALKDHETKLIFGASIGPYLETELLGREVSVRVSRPDIIVRTGTSSEDGPLWAPVDIKSHEAIDENKSNSVYVANLPELATEKAIKVTGRLLEKDALQLAHYLEHLKEIGFSDNINFAAIIGKNMEKIVWADLTQTMFGIGQKSDSAVVRYAKRFNRAAVVVDKAVERSSNPTLPAVTIPKRISGDFGCPACEFRTICRNAMEEFGHVTLLSEVTAPKAEEHFPDIETIETLANATGLSPFGMKSVLRANVWIDKNPQLIDQATPLALPNFDVEIDIDLENTQAIFQEAEFEDIPVKDSVYLYGYGIHDRTKNLDWNSAKIDYFDNYSNAEEGEVEVLTSMWNKLQELVRQFESEGKTVGIFHYSAHEVTWWRKFANRHQGKPGVPTTEEVDRFVARYFVDLLTYTRKIAFPLTGYSIKTLAKAADFKWKVDDAGGGNSLIKFQTAVSKGASESKQREAIEWLRSYNMDDVRATYAVRNYIRKLEL